MIQDNNEQQFMASGESGGSNWPYPYMSTHDVVGYGIEYFNAVNETVRNIMLSEVLREGSRGDDLEVYYKALDNFPEGFDSHVSRWKKIREDLENRNPKLYETIEKLVDCGDMYEEINQYKTDMAKMLIEELGMNLDNCEVMHAGFIEKTMNDPNITEEQRIFKLVLQNEIIEIAKNILTWPEDYTDQDQII